MRAAEAPAVVLLVCATLTAAWPSTLISSSDARSAAAADTEQECVCGSESVSPRIINGRRAKAGHFPWIVYVRLAGGWDSCTGSLINDDWVLTSAHCVPSHLDPFDMAVHVGQECGITRTWSPHFDGIRVKRIHRHEQFQGGPGYDIALLQLEPLPFGSAPRHFMPVCLSGNQTTSSVDNLLVSGWGLVNEGLQRRASECLNEADLDVVDQAECLKHGASFAAEHVMCAGGRQNICHGDSGGPLMTRKNGGRMVQVGITSFGRADCSILTETPAGFEKVSDHLQWIRHHVGHERVCVQE